MLNVLFWTKNIPLWTASFGVYIIEIFAFYKIASGAIVFPFRQLFSGPLIAIIICIHTLLFLQVFCAGLLVITDLLFSFIHSLCVFMEQSPSLYKNCQHYYYIYYDNNVNISIIAFPYMCACAAQNYYRLF